MNYGYQPQQMQGYPQFQQAQMPQFSPQYPMDRLAQLQQEAAIRDAQAQMHAQQQAPGLKLIPVGSIEEAKGYLSPPDGSRIFFINSSNEEIYSKQLDFSTGKSNFLVYKLNFEQPEEKAEPLDFISRDEFNSIKTEYEALKKELNKLKKMLRDKLDTEEEE